MSKPVLKTHPFGVEASEGMVKVSEYCHSVDEPVLLTKDGAPDLVVMSVETWEEDQYWAYVEEKLDEAEAEYQASAPTTDMHDFLEELSQRLHDANQS